MNKFLLFLLLFPFSARSQINIEHRQELISRSLSINLRINNGYVPTNTAAFQEYALDVLIKQANVINEKWRLEIPGTITSDRAEDFMAAPSVYGPEGSLTVDRRYRFSAGMGCFTFFLRQNVF